MKLTEVNKVTRDIRIHPAITVDKINRAKTVRSYPNYSKGVQTEKRMIMLTKVTCKKRYEDIRTV